jgi:hypothetical protein
MEKESSITTGYHIQKNVVGLLLHTIWKPSDLDLRVTDTKLLEENLGVNLYNHRFGKGFLGMTPKAQVRTTKKGEKKRREGGEKER